MRFENLVACHLLKWCFYRQDTAGHDTELRYFRDVDKREVDFVIVEDQHPVHFIECKTKEKEASSALRYLKIRFPAVTATQLVLEADMDLVTKDGIRVCSAHRFLKELI